jgi:hypothetical protein
LFQVLLTDDPSTEVTRDGTRAHLPRMVLSPIEMNSTARRSTAAASAWSRGADDCVAYHHWRQRDGFLSGRGRGFGSLLQAESWEVPRTEQC